MWVDAFAISRFPVTNAEYLVFLNDLVARGREEEALRYQPLAGHSAADPSKAAPVYRRVGGRFELGVDEKGLEWDPGWPVTQISWWCADAYRVWKSHKQERCWRLLVELEREKAARGADGRHYPWGDSFDAGFSRVAKSIKGPPHPTHIEQFPADISPFSVRSLAGNTRDWCGNQWLREGPVGNGAMMHPAADWTPTSDMYMSVRGGAFGGKATSSRSAGRFGNQPAIRSSNLGVRLGFSL